MSATTRFNIRLTKAANAKLRATRTYKRGDLRLRLLGSLVHADTVPISIDTAGRDYATSVTLNDEDIEKLKVVAGRRNVSVATLINACLSAL